MSDYLDNLHWFYQHCFDFHYLLETDVPMYDVSIFIMEYIIRLEILFVADLIMAIQVFTKSKSRRLAICVEPIAILLMQLIQDDNVSVGKLRALQESKTTWGTKTEAPALPLVSVEQNTPLTSNLSEMSKQIRSPQQQNQLLSHNLEVKSSQKLPIVEAEVLKETANKLLPEQASLKLDPVKGK